MKYSAVTITELGYLTHALNAKVLKYLLSEKGEFNTETIKRWAWKTFASFGFVAVFGLLLTVPHKKTTQNKHLLRNTQHLLTIR
jgi:hypothetical protein